MRAHHILVGEHIVLMHACMIRIWKAINLERVHLNRGIEVNVMVDKKKKYVINVDFPTTSRVHLNPYYFDSMWCRLDEEKYRIHGGKVYATSEEARNFLNNKETLYFDGKAVRNLTRCLNCSRRGKQSVHWDI